MAFPLENYAAAYGSELATYLPGSGHGSVDAAIVALLRSGIVAAGWGGSLPPVVTPHLALGVWAAALDSVGTRGDRQTDAARLVHGAFTTALGRAPTAELGSGAAGVAAEVA